jgi:hypothetical protein
MGKLLKGMNELPSSHAKILLSLIVIIQSYQKENKSRVVASNCCKRNQKVVF